MKKFGCTLLAALLALNLAACGSGPSTPAPGADQTSASSSAYQAGSYQGTAPGRNGDITVEVVVTADAIQSVTVTAHSETTGIADPAIERIPADITAYQSLGIDAVSGATITSGAIVEAAAAALEKAGADVAALRQIPVNKETAPAEDMTTQVVVAGGGMSGIVAALTAKAHGAEVILVEKQGMLGGSAITSAGGLVTVDSKLVDNDSVGRVLEYTRQMNETSERQPNYDFLEAILLETGKTIDYISEEFGITPEFQDRGDYIRSLYGSGRALITGLEEQLKDRGATILVNTSAQEILMDGDNAVGLKVKGEGGEFTIHADKIIIATGGANGDRERMLAANPALAVLDLREAAAAGNTGDGFRMLEEIGAKMGDGPYIKSAMIGSNISGHWLTADNQLLFDAEGNRFCNESPMFATMTNTFLLRQGSPAYYLLFDEEHTDPDLLEGLKAAAAENDPKKAIYGATLTELAEKLNIQANTLQSTFDRYQQLCVAGTDTDFGKDAEHLIPYSEGGGFYAAYVYPGSWGTFGGAITDTRFHVLREDGSVIPNIFAVGECASAEFFGDYYQGAFSLGLYSAAGRIAAETAVEEIGQR